MLLLYIIFNHVLLLSYFALAVIIKLQFNNMIKQKIKEIWSWSTTQCSVYPLEGIDTIASDGTLQWNSALSFIVSGETEDHLDMLEIGLVKQVLSDKWATFAKVKKKN